MKEIEQLKEKRLGKRREKDERNFGNSGRKGNGIYFYPLRKGVGRERENKNGH